MRQTARLGSLLAVAATLGLVAAIGLCAAGCGSATPPAPVLAVSVAELSFGAGATTLTFDISNTGGGSLTWSISADKAWVTVAPGTGTDDATVSVIVDRSSLPAGESTAALTITSDGGDAAVSVTVTTSPASLVTPLALDFGRATETMSLAIANTGTGALLWQCAPSDDWITVAPTSGTGDATVDVTVDRTGLPPGESTGSVSVTTNDGQATVPVTVGVNNAPAVAVFTASASRVATGATVYLTGVGSDADGDPLIYAWSATAGSVAGTGVHAVFTAPATPADVTITCAVTDSFGGSDDRDVSIEVFPTGDMGIVISSDEQGRRGN